MDKKQDYMVGTDGCLVRTDTPLVGGWDKCTTLQQLMAHANSPLDTSVEQRVKWVGSKMPAELLQKVLGTIRKFPTREVGFTLQYKVSNGSWRVTCPEQSGSGGAVHFKDEEATDGYAIIGTIHTHPNMAAFWSGTDLQDQEGKFGLHIVFGLDDGIANRVLCTLFTPGGKYDHELDEICEHVDGTQPYEPVQEWVDTIERQGYKKELATQPTKAPLPSYTCPKWELRPPARNTWWQPTNSWDNTPSAEPDYEDDFALDEERMAACMYDLEALIQDVGLDTVLQTLKDMFPELLIIDQEELKDKSDVVDAVEDCMLHLEDTTAAMEKAKIGIAWTLACHGFLDTKVLTGFGRDRLSCDLADDDMSDKLRKYAETFVSNWIAVNGIPKAVKDTKEKTDA